MEKARKRTVPHTHQLQICTYVKTCKDKISSLMPSRNHVRIITYNCLFTVFQRKAMDTKPPFQHFAHVCKVLAIQSRTRVTQRHRLCRSLGAHLIQRHCMRKITCSWSFNIDCECSHLQKNIVKTFQSILKVNWSRRTQKKTCKSD